MQPQYDWQKGKDAWEEIEISGQKEPSQPKLVPPPHWQFIGVVILLIAMVGVSVVWFLNRRARTNMAAIEKDILGTNSLIFQAAALGDTELLRSFLSGRDSSWQSGIESAVASGIFNDRSAWGLLPVTVLPDESEIDVRLNPEWNSAELTIPLDYESADTGETVRLEQTFVYRRSQDKWLLAPPDVLFWGPNRVFEGRYLKITYPERDKEIVQRLAVDLERLVDDICERVEDLACTADFQVELTLSNQPETFSQNFYFQRLFYCLNYELKMPAPSLIGIPVDDAGFEALYSGYSSEVTIATFDHLVATEDCSFGPLKLATVDYRLSDLGYRPWPLEADDYALLLGERVHLKQLFYFLQLGPNSQKDWDFNSGKWGAYYAFIEFLVEKYGTPLRKIEADLDGNRLEGSSYWSTLHDWTDKNFADDGPLEADWQAFLVEKAGANTADAPPFPNQNLRMACYGGNISTGIAYPSGVLYELDLATGEMTAVLPLDHTEAYMVSLPGDESIVVSEQRPNFVQENARVLLWEDDEPVVLFETAENLIPVPAYASTSSTEQVLFYNPQRGRYEMLPLASCQSDGSCNLLTQPGFPIWPPSGDLMMWAPAIGAMGYESQHAVQLILQGVSGSDEFVGRSPYWIERDRFGYLADSARAAMAVRVDENGFPGEVEVLFTLEEVDELLALDSAASIESVLPRPEEPQDLIVTVTDRNGWASIYQVNVLRRWIQPLTVHAFKLNTRGPGSIPNHFEYSPDGRWLVISAYDQASFTASLFLFDMEKVEAHSFEYRMDFERPMHWTIDWSAGDEWLAVPDNGYIRLINPAEDYQDVVVPDGVGCMGAVWVNGE